MRVAAVMKATMAAVPPERAAAAREETPALRGAGSGAVKRGRNASHGGDAASSIRG